MTTVLVLARSPRRLRVEGILRWAVLVCLALWRPASAQDRPVHWLNAGAMPPGAIGSQRLHRGGPLSGYFQPVRIRAPQGARIALAVDGSFADSPPGEALVGMQIGPVYPLKVTDIPNHPGLEMFPTVEVIDRLYPPPGLALRFPVPIELTQDELDLAARGSFVTRVIYIEDPHTALPIAQRADGEQPWVEAPQGEDPMVTADIRGRAVAILRIGSRVPNAETQAGLAECAPPAVIFDPKEACPGEIPPEGVRAEMMGPSGPVMVIVPGNDELFYSKAHSPCPLAEGEGSQAADARVAQRGDAAFEVKQPAEVPAAEAAPKESAPVLAPPVVSPRVMKRVDLSRSLER
jgi:hypothetical protein